MKHSLETKLSNFKEINFDLEENISDDQLEKIYGGKLVTFKVGEQDRSKHLRRRRFRGLWNFFFRLR